MKKQYFINANIIDPYNSINENGGLIIGEDGFIGLLRLGLQRSRMFFRVAACRYSSSEHCFRRRAKSRLGAPRTTYGQRWCRCGRIM